MTSWILNRDSLGLMWLQIARTSLRAATLSKLWYHWRCWLRKTSFNDRSQGVFGIWWDRWIPNTPVRRSKVWSMHCSIDDTHLDATVDNGIWNFALSDRKTLKIDLKSMEVKNKSLLFLSFPCVVYKNLRIKIQRSRNVIENRRKRNEQSDDSRTVGRTND